MLQAEAGRAIVLAEARSGTECAEAVRHLVEDPARRERLGRAARRLYEREFSCSAPASYRSVRP